MELNDKQREALDNWWAKSKERDYNKKKLIRALRRAEKLYKIVKEESDLRLFGTPGSLSLREGDKFNGGGNKDNEVECFDLCSDCGDSD